MGRNGRQFVEQQSPGHPGCVFAQPIIPKQLSDGLNPRQRDLNRVLQDLCAASPEAVRQANRFEPFGEEPDGLVARHGSMIARASYVGQTIQGCRRPSVLTQILNAIGLTTTADAAAWKGRADKLESRASELQEQVQAGRERERVLKADLHKRDHDLERARADAQHAHADTQRAERENARLTERTEQLSAAKADVERLKAQVRELEHEKKRLTEQVAELEARLADGRTRQDALTAEVAEQRARADKGIHAARVAREQLMAFEVKLDLVEGAIRVLDTRTRTADPVLRS